MKKGSMELIVQEQGAFKTVAIQEGQVSEIISCVFYFSVNVFVFFVRYFYFRERFRIRLRGKMTQSGWQSREKERNKNWIASGKICNQNISLEELIFLSEYYCRYFVNDSTESLFERWFYCDDLGVQLVPVIKEFFASEQCKTGRPVPGTIPENPHFHPDGQLQLENPFNLKEWLQSHGTEIHQNGKKNLFDGAKYKSDVIIYGKGVDEFKAIQHEIWLWQLVNYRKIDF